MPEPITSERLAEIRSKPFDELTSQEMLDWLTADPEAYRAAAMANARRMVEREAEAARRRRVSRLAHLLRGDRRG